MPREALERPTWAQILGRCKIRLLHWKLASTQSVAGAIQIAIVQTSTTGQKQIGRSIMRQTTKTLVLCGLIVSLGCIDEAVASQSALHEAARRTGYSVSQMEEILAKCDDSQASMNVCAEVEFVKVDLELAQAFRKLSARMGERSGNELKKIPELLGSFS
jgi:hypothetical protein